MKKIVIIVVMVMVIIHLECSLCHNQVDGRRNGRRDGREEEEEEKLRVGVDTFLRSYTTSKTTDADAVNPNWFRLGKE